MPKKTYTQINSITLAVASSSVTLGSIPQNFRDLVLVYSGTNSDSNAGVSGRFNSDSGAAYSVVQMNGYSTGPNGTAGGPNTETDFFFGGTSLATGVLQIMDYSATDKHKTALVRTDVGQLVGATRAAAIRYANTSAITSISLFRTAGATISAGSTFTLYGIEA